MLVFTYGPFKNMCRFAEPQAMRQRVTALCRARALEPGCQGSAKTPPPGDRASRQFLACKTGSSRLRVADRTRQAWCSRGCHVTAVWVDGRRFKRPFLDPPPAGQAPTAPFLGAPFISSSMSTVSGENGTEYNLESF